MKKGERLNLEQIRAFLEASDEVEFEASDRQEVYEWMTGVLRQHGYDRQSRPVKGLLRSYLRKMTGLSRAQVTRLIGRYVQEREIREETYRRYRFPGRFTRADIELLAAVDEAHETLSGPATRRILEREFHDYGHQEYERLATISVSHLYNLRQSRTYRQRRVSYSQTRPTTVAIGERRAPRPRGRPGYLRVDTVHQGDQDGVKGVYHINAVDEVTQWQVVGATPYISEAWLIPVLRAILRQFPFQIRGFHSDNGSEYINQRVEKLLNKLLIEQTKSRPRHSNDNGLAESKNGSVIRKHLGYGYIAADDAEKIQAFYERSFNPYLNFHRPCGQAEIITQKNGKQRRVYRRWETPWETFRQLPEAAGYLKPKLSLQALARQAQTHSDTESARQMQAAKQRLFASFRTQKRSDGERPRGSRK